MTPQTLIVLRTAVGLTQGLALYLLYRAAEKKGWPATDGLIFAPLLFVAAFSPPIILLGLGNIRLRTLVIWVLGAIAVVAGLAIHDISRNPGDGAFFAGQSGLTMRIIPSPSLWLWTSAGLFIAHSLIAAADNERKIVATYPRYFELAWKYAVQHLLAFVFVSIFWGLLWLGAELFGLVKIEFFRETIKKPWFYVPVTALAFACAIHVTDVRAGLVRGMRTLVLTLLSWLLPMMALIAIGFLFALPITGLEPLWSTRRATSVLLIAAAALVILINAAYQDGQAETRAPRVLRYAALAATASLGPLVGLAAYGLWLRIDQYGWTPDRIIALACVVVAICYAGGYALAAIRGGPRLKGLEATNVLTAFIIVAVLLALFTPIADPARISVADQVARLEAGTIAPEKFDFAFLRFGSGRYGNEALERLKRKQDGAGAVLISTKANEALDWKNRGEARRQQPRPTAEGRAANIVVIYPKGQTLPDSFLRQEWPEISSQWRLPRCLVTFEKREAILADLDDDGKSEILLIASRTGTSATFKLVDDGTWRFFGRLTNVDCTGVRDDLRNGQFNISQYQLKDIEVRGQRLRTESGCR